MKEGAPHHTQEGQGSRRQSQKTACLVIPETTPLDIVKVLKRWEHNPEGVPAAIQQEPDGGLNYTDVNIWMWFKAVLPKRGYIPM